MDRPDVSDSPCDNLMRAFRLTFSIASVLLCSLTAVAAEVTPSPARLSAPPTLPSEASQQRADPENLLVSADEALQGGRLVEAEGLLDRYRELGQNPVSDDARETEALLRSELMLATGHPADALAELRLRGPAKVQTCRAAAAKGMALILLGQFAAASDALQPSRRECAADPVFWRALGRLYLSLGSPVDAVSALQTAISTAPNDRALRNDLAVALIAANLPGEAIDLLSELVHEQTEDAEARVNLDYAGAMLGRVPTRGKEDSDTFWSRRLQFAGAGARQVGRTGLAEALLGQALIERPRYDAQLWRQYSELTGK